MSRVPPPWLALVKQRQGSDCEKPADEFGGKRDLVQPRFRSRSLEALAAEPPVSEVANLRGVRPRTNAGLRPVARMSWVRLPTSRFTNRRGSVQVSVHRRSATHFFGAEFEPIS